MIGHRPATTTNHCLKKVSLIYAPSYRIEAKWAIFTARGTGATLASKALARCDRRHIPVDPRDRPSPLVSAQVDQANAYLASFNKDSRSEAMHQVHGRHSLTIPLRCRRRL